ncbi:hypothetical protein vBBcePLY3_00044 [Bacillus phage vB_BceP_LY3]|uniref:Uncharacterized protein n=1 Tax=Bacillus phage vB_BceP_LY3 TaxID=2950458 RepID=A0AAE9S210_9CAUD|nr:hypothetical protein vBBcePLY3_00044 [Bacillus phage vB_BceP_LY3]
MDYINLLECLMIINKKEREGDITHKTASQMQTLCQELHEIWKGKQK